MEPLKCRTIDADLPGRDSFHPRPLLPGRIGSWVPRAVNMVKSRYLEVEGYTKASYINFSASETIYISYSPAGSLLGIFAEDGEDRQAIHLGRPSKRAVRLFGLQKIGQYNIVLVQVSIARLGPYHLLTTLDPSGRRTIPSRT